MSHLSPERLAALADEEPTASELAHLATCPVCSAERDAHVGLLGMATAERTSIGLPLTRWESLSTALRADGLVATPASGPARVMHGAGRRAGRIWLQAAAALLFVAGGTALGRVSAGAAPLPGLGRGDAVAAGETPSFSSLEDARLARTQAQVTFQTAAAYIAQHDSSPGGTESPSAMRTRLAALDQVSTAMRAALNDAPYDPVINNYYLTTLGQREATLRQINTALPVGLRVNSF